MKKLSICLLVSIFILMFGVVAVNAQSVMTPPKTTGMKAVPVMKSAPRPVVMRAISKPKPKVMKPVPKPVAPVAVAAMPVPSMVAVPATQPAARLSDTKPDAKPTVKAAPVEKQDNWWQTLLGGLINIALLFVLGILTVLGKFFIQWLATKVKISDHEKVAAMQGLYTSAIEMGVNFATQKANQLNNNPDAKSQRIKWATDKATEMIKAFNLPEKTAGWIEDAIEAKLGEKNGTKTVESEDAEKPAKEKSEEKAKDNDNS